MASRQVAQLYQRCQKQSLGSFPKAGRASQGPILRTRSSGIRHNSTQASGPKVSANRAPLYLAVGSVLGGGLGYFFATSGSSPANSQQIPNSSTGLANSYGSPDDFRKALSELQAAFPEEDKVSTDSEVLHFHGFSDNDYHPGACAVQCNIRASSLTIFFQQARHQQLLYIRKVPKMSLSS